MDVRSRGVSPLALNPEDEQGRSEETTQRNLAAVTIFPTGPARCNCMLILDRMTGDLVVCNPGGSFEAIVAELKTLAATTGVSQIRLAYILVNQAHVTTFLSAAQVLNIGNGAGEVVLHEQDLELWKRAELQAAEFGFPELYPEGGFPEPTCLCTHGEILEAGRIQIQCIHSPGVSPGAMCYYFPQLELVTTGTTLMAQSLGRTSWLGMQSLVGTANPRLLRRSIDEKLMDNLPGDTRAVPAFGPLTTLRTELHKNAHLKRLSSRWEAYDDTQEMKKRAAEAAAQLAADPFGDGLPF